MKSNFATILVLAILSTVGLADEKPLPDGGVTNSVGMKLRRIRAGTFLMGSPVNGRNSSQNVQRRVQITRDFYMGETVVTQRQWEAVMGTRPWKLREYAKEGPNYPATFVKWSDAVAFCHRLTDTSRRKIGTNSWASIRRGKHSHRPGCRSKDDLLGLQARQFANDLSSFPQNKANGRAVGPTRECLECRPRPMASIRTADLTAGKLNSSMAWSP